MSFQHLLKANPLLWQGKQFYSQAKTISTGFTELDTALPTEGWPLGSLIEVLTPNFYSGALRLFLPALAEISRQQAQLAWINPPCTPYAPGLLQHGVDTQQLLVIEAKDTWKDPYWCMEKLLRTDRCGAGLLWCKQPNIKSLRRLQLAAEYGGSLGVIFCQTIQPHSPATTRLFVKTDAAKSIQVSILKARGTHQRATLPICFD